MSAFVLQRTGECDAAVIQRGVQLAVCALGTFTAAYMIAGPAGAYAAGL